MGPLTTETMYSITLCSQSLNYWSNFIVTTLGYSKQGEQRDQCNEEAASHQTHWLYINKQQPTEEEDDGLNGYIHCGNYINVVVTTQMQDSYSLLPPTRMACTI